MEEQLCVLRIFFSKPKIAHEDSFGKSQVALKKCKGNSKNSTASHLKQEGTLGRLVHLDEGNKF